jgi:hypothetical protein
VVLDGPDPIAPGVYSEWRGCPMALEKELETYKERFEELKDKHAGKFVLIHGDQVVNAFSSYDDAINAGYAEFGLDSFLVKRVQVVEQAQFISRLVDPCVGRDAA